MSSQKTVTVTPPKSPINGKVLLPGSKSITNRVLLLAALAKGTSRLSGALKSDDTNYMSIALRQMGVTIDEPDNTTFVVTGSGKLQMPTQPLFLGNAGTAMRFLTAASVLVEGIVVQNGDNNMHTRPISPLLAALSQNGIRVDSQTGYPPVIVHGVGKMHAKRFEIDGSLSSQYVSALLMLAACGEAPAEIVLTGKDISANGYIDLTLNCMRAFGAKIKTVNDTTWHVAPTGYTARNYLIEPDASAATYLWAAEVLTGGRIDIGIDAPDFTQPDAKAKAIITQFPNIQTIVVGSKIQDAIPTLAVLAAFNNTPVRFTELTNLRIKECDRVQALYNGLNKICHGLASIDGDDLLIASDPTLANISSNALIDTQTDHRIAMCFALAGLKITGIRIQNPGCVAKTYPEYWKTLVSLGVVLCY
ncbi:3-phosphoshikimate 1-carboxyvinyltransferase [Candidatus Pseudomonas adelgestsugas]|uniref:3-phosphoshikimate 1-carboxyvinyltransferase n=1 Tax=Candidatus Pseudomonas adelgestsugas TaxID=1302376 RepID=A0ABX5R8R0_9PSED|nr:3-phosphoshikimate 1-carboxyvinyltransferase [Candidatus Pseudomonas adelgestsugas]QAX81811.1 3-phosphoshikimate 1-carboxyvinyltransferase [Candidatus Pseudomonas adelgestsugas]